jgi:hypothetical protein
MALTALGITSFNQILPPRWDTDSWGLDRLTLTYDGYVTGLATFVNSYTQWESNSVDSNMYLSQIAVGSDKRYPKVELIYIGKRGGIMPPVRMEHGNSLETSSYNDGESQLEILYRAPHTVQTWIAANDAMAHSGFLSPDQPSVVMRRVDGHIPVVYRYAEAIRNSIGYAQADDKTRKRIDAYLNSAAVSSAVDAAKRRITAMFNRSFTQDDQVTNFSAAELVPGRYWQCSSTTSRLLVPV